MDVDALISYVRERPQMWDRNDRRHTSKQEIDRCWREISALMNEHEFKLRQKWRYLKHQFACESGKIAASLAADEVYITKRPYYQSMLFLKNNVTSKPPSEKWKSMLKRTSSVRRRYYNCLKKTDDLCDTQDVHTSRPVRYKDPLNIIGDIMQLDTTDESDDNSNDITSNDDLLKHDTTAPVQNDTRSLTQLQIKRKTPDVDPPLLFAEPEKDDNDEHVLFFRSLLPHIRKIPPEQLLSFRSDVQRTVEMYAYQI